MFQNVPVKIFVDGNGPNCFAVQRSSTQAKQSRTVLLFAEPLRPYQEMLYAEPLLSAGKHQLPVVGSHICLHHRKTNLKASICHMSFTESSSQN